MSDPAILFVKPKAISTIDKVRLRDAGVIVVEVANPQDVKLTRPHAELDGSEMLLCAIQVIEKTLSKDVREAFATNICRAIMAKHNPNP